MGTIRFTLSVDSSFTVSDASLSYEGGLENRAAAA